MKHYFGQVSDFKLTWFGPIHIILILITFGLDLPMCFKYNLVVIRLPFRKLVPNGILASPKPRGQDKNGKRKDKKLWL